MMLKHTALPTERGGVCERETGVALMNQEVWVAANPKIGTTKDQEKNTTSQRSLCDCIFLEMHYFVNQTDVHACICM